MARPPALLVRLDHFARPLRVVMDGATLEVTAAQPRPDLEQGLYGGSAAQVWDVTLDDGQSFILVRDMARGGWSRVAHSPEVG